MINGIIFQKVDNRKYKGVDGYNWYLNDIYQDILGKYFDENIDKSWYSPDYVDVCSEEAFINNYIELSKRENINFRMILCETEKKYPKLEARICNAKFIGYDYAYSGGSYYSAVLNDICLRKIGEFAKIKLNVFGLFDDLKNTNEFIKVRNQLITERKDYLFEKGDFIIYKLYEIDSDFRKIE